MMFEDILKTRIDSITPGSAIVLYPRNEVAEHLLKYTQQKKLSASIADKASDVMSADVVVVCEDEDKDEALKNLDQLDWKGHYPKVLLAGQEHLSKNQKHVERIESDLAIQSGVLGYETTKAHLFECLSQIKNSGITGWIIELGSFEGHTLLLMNEIVKELGLSETTRLIGFDAWDDTIHRHRFLDLFDMETWVGKDAVRVRSLVPAHIDLIKGDIVETFPKWAADINEPIVFAFIDTDHYSPVHAALPLIWERLAVGGCVLFDHFYTHEAFYNTIGEFVAANEFFKNRDDVFHLSGTGVFQKVQKGNL